MATDERNNAASELPSLGARLDSFAARADSFLEMNDAEKAAFLQGMSDATDEVLREQDRVVLMALLNEALDPPGCARNYLEVRAEQV